MKTNKIILVVILTILLSTALMGQSTWTMDKAHAKLGFSITHLMISTIEGNFKTFDAKISSTKDDFTDASATLTAEVKSINTDNEQRDTHLKTADFFDADKYPVLTFKTTSIKKIKDNNYKIIGNLTMHGVTKSIELNATGILATHPVTKKTIVGFKISGLILRSDFGIGLTFPNAMIGDEVTLDANAEFTKD